MITLTLSDFDFSKYVKKAFSNKAITGSFGEIWAQVTPWVYVSFWHLTSASVSVLNSSKSTRKPAITFDFMEFDIQMRVISFNYVRHDIFVSFTFYQPRDYLCFTSIIWWTFKLKWIFITVELTWYRSTFIVHAQPFKGTLSPKRCHQSDCWNE